MLRTLGEDEGGEREIQTVRQRLVRDQDGGARWRASEAVKADRSEREAEQ